MKKLLFPILLGIFFTLICFGKFFPLNARAESILQKNNSGHLLAETEYDDRNEQESNSDSNSLPAIPEGNNSSPIPVPVDPGLSSSSDLSLPWYVARSAGITAYLLMFLIIVLGEGMTTGFAYALMTPVKAWVIHKYLGIAFGVTLLVHILSLLFDKFISFNLSDVLVPYSSSYQTNYVGLGIFGFYLVLAIILSSLLVRLRFPFFWRYVHFLVYPLFVLSFIHGVSIGTDTGTSIMQIMYSMTGTIFILLLLYRWRFHLSRK